MSESLYIDKNTTREEKYKSLIPQIEALITGEKDLIANLANICSALYFGMDYFWVGFYEVKAEQLVLAPFHGPIACTRINFGKGVCGTAWKEKKILNVPNVDEFPGHIACSSDSKSEIVLPILVNGEVRFILDIDSSRLNDFDTVDEFFLAKLVRIIEKTIN